MDTLSLRDMEKISYNAFGLNACKNILLGVAIGDALI